MQYHHKNYLYCDFNEHLNDLIREQEGSTWLTTIPLSEEGYDLTKQLFWDLIRIRYGCTLTRLPSNCECGIKFDIQHALSCKKVGLIHYIAATSETLC